MKCLTIFLALALALFTIEASELTCGFAQNYHHHPKRFQIVRSELENEKATLNIRYKDFNSYKVSYFKEDERLDYEKTIIMENLKIEDSIDFPFNSDYSLILGINNDPEGGTMALHCWLENL